jgi:hypothetical protein
LVALDTDSDPDPKRQAVDADQTESGSTTLLKRILSHLLLVLFAQFFCLFEVISLTICGKVLVDLLLNG